MGMLKFNEEASLSKEQASKIKKFSDTQLAMARKFGLSFADSTDDLAAMLGSPEGDMPDTELAGGGAMIPAPSKPGDRKPEVEGGKEGEEKEEKGEEKEDNEVMGRLKKLIEGEDTPKEIKKQAEELVAQLEELEKAEKNAEELLAKNAPAETEKEGEASSAGAEGLPLNPSPSV